MEECRLLAVFVLFPICYAQQAQTPLVVHPKNQESCPLVFLLLNDLFTLPPYYHTKQKNQYGCVLTL